MAATPLAAAHGVDVALLGQRVTADSPVAARLRAAGAVILGKANLSEWANFRGFAPFNGWTARGGFTARVISSADVMHSVGIPAASTTRAISPTD